MSANRPTLSAMDRRYVTVGTIGFLLGSLVLAKTYVHTVEGQFDPGDSPGLRVNVNTADVGTLGLLTAIGPERARQIVAYRTEHGPFRTYAELMRVSGIGKKTADGLVEQVCFDD